MRKKAEGGVELVDLGARDGSVVPRGTRFELADLGSSCGADLRHRDLSHLEGLRPSDLSGADLTGAKLPEGFTFEGLAQIELISRNGTKVFIVLLSACVYVWLSIGMTTDVQLIENSATTPLPVIGTPIPIARFYAVAAAILAAIYCYLHFYMQRLWRILADLPAIFPDGQALDDKSYPWLMTGMVRAHFKCLLPQDRPLAQAEAALTVVLAWGLVPFTVLGLWLRFMPRHDWLGSAWLILLTTLTVAFGVATYRLKSRTLGHELALYSRAQTSSQNMAAAAWRDLKAVLWPRSTILLAIALAVFSWSAFTDPPPHALGGNPAWKTGRWIPWAFQMLGLRTYADFREAEISTKLEGWQEGNTEHVRGADLRNRRLNFVDASLAFLARADLRGADLERAELAGANLDAAQLKNANMHMASLPRATLRSSSLESVNLESAHMYLVDLSRAKIGRANLQYTNLAGANLAGAELKDSNLREAYLFAANLKGTNLRRANLDTADLFIANLESASLRGANLLRADLRGARLRHADLRDAYFYEAELLAADLQNADLSGADLRGARGLAQDQLNSACGDQRTEVPVDLYVRACDDR